MNKDVRSIIPVLPLLYYIYWIVDLISSCTNRNGSEYSTSHSRVGHDRHILFSSKERLILMEGLHEASYRCRLHLTLGIPKSALLHNARLLTRRAHFLFGIKGENPTVLDLGNCASCPRATKVGESS